MDHALPVKFDLAPEQPISIELALYGGIFAKRHMIPCAGSYVAQHAHGYDHLSILAFGGLRVWCDGEVLGDFHAPAEIRIPAHTLHTFMTLVAGTTVYCVHSAEHFDETERAHLPGLPA